MPRQAAKSPAYKELTLQQLRSFCETARLGSLAAAAKTLGLTHPTVREQVLALQRDFGVQLIEPHRRGCRLTAEGQLLAEFAMPIITATNGLRKRFELAQSTAEVRLTIAGPPRVIQEDLPDAILALLKSAPQVRVAFLELHDDLVIQAVESGAADLGLTSEGVPGRPPPGLSIEPAYELETLLVTPKGHPLAKKRSVRPADLRHYPLVSSRHSLSDQPALAANLDRNRVFDGPAPRVEPFLAATVRTYVKLNLGIALIYGLPPRRRNAFFHERSMSEYFGRGLVRFVLRKGSAHEEWARMLMGLIRTCNALPS
ncbi:HTH-type transcriptional regulator CysB [Anatilimnocola aggregata]|uniref:HTH-type transcriptional regulator CysB n=1 Tax=Anatilimnocola aggregata TaxID=2528021 RepID=A0A517YHQ3_9BACT|nr:LysR family transcriptional regulator [Anatilimnocola aggregata]QDU29753.1 HTH-type transcriptional regulator CysB [Anatilimnocola aggregata]